jgi:hypothetical protein
MNNIEFLAYCIDFLNFFGDYFLILKLLLCVFLSQNLFAVQYRHLKIYIWNLGLFAVLFPFFFYIFCAFFHFFCEFKVFELNFPWHYWLNYIIFLVPGVKILLQKNWHAGQAVCLRISGKGSVHKGLRESKGLRILELTLGDIFGFKEPFPILNLSEVMAADVLIITAMKLLHDFRKLISFPLNDLSISKIF